MNSSSAPSAYGASISRDLCALAHRARPFGIEAPQPLGGTSTPTRSPRSGGAAPAGARTTTAWPSLRRCQQAVRARPLGELERVVAVRGPVRTSRPRPGTRRARRRRAGGSSAACRRTAPPTRWPGAPRSRRACRAARRRPSRSTATRSPSASASAWSCVTYSAVTPVSSCTRRISPRVRHAQLGVEVRQRLVEQQHARSRRQRARQRHPLALAAGELAGPAVEQPLEAERVRRLAHARGDRALASRAPAARTRCCARRSGAGTARSSGRPSPRRARRARRRVWSSPPISTRPVSGLLEAGDRPQQRRLARAGGAEHGDELAWRDGEGDLTQGLDVAVAARDSLYVERGAQNWPSVSSASRSSAASSSMRP